MSDDYIPIEQLKGHIRKEKVRKFVEKVRVKGRQFGGSIGNAFSGVRREAPKAEAKAKTAKKTIAQSLKDSGVATFFQNAGRHSLTGGSGFSSRGGSIGSFDFGWQYRDKKRR